jgi:Putative beta-barrel porin 2
MILPCRIHRDRKRNRVDSLPLALLLATCFLAPIGEAISQDAIGSAAEAAGIGWLPAVPIQITAGVDTGYNDNVTLQPSGEGSIFTRENVVLTYNRPGERTQFFVMGVGRFSQYFDVSGQNETAGNVTLSLTHNFSSRLSFYASVYGTYQNQPNFQSNVGPQNVVSPFFDTVDIFALTYHWSSRLSSVTSYTFERVQYISSSNGNSQNGVQNTLAQNRTQNTFSEAFRFSLTSRTVLVSEYRFETINYDTAPIDSTTHFILGGVNHNLTEHLIVHVLAGESFRSLENAGDSSLPNFEGSLEYARSNYSLNWMASYGFESPTTTGATTTKTLRTGLNLTCNLTSRLSSTTGVYYHHDENQGSASSGTGSAGAQDSLDLLLGFNYTLNKRLALHVNYNYTSQSSIAGTPGYSRNSYSAGLTYTY